MAIGLQLVTIIMFTVSIVFPVGLHQDKVTAQTLGLSFSSLDFIICNNDDLGLDGRW